MPDEKPRPNWRIYYEDGSTWSDLDGPWADAPGAVERDRDWNITRGPGPGKGVLCVVVRDPSGAVGRWVHSGFYPPSESPMGNDYYVCCPGEDEPYAVDREGLALFFDKVGGERWELVKHGRQTAQLDWLATMDRAIDDPDFPRRSPRRRSTDA